MGSIGPTEGDVVHYHRDAGDQSWMVPTRDLDCYLHLVRIDAASDVKRRISLSFRNFRIVGFHEENATDDKCETAFIELYEDKGEGFRPDDGKKPVYRQCGNTKPREYNAYAQEFILHLYVRAPEWAKAKAKEKAFFRKTTGETTNGSTIISPRIDFIADFTSYIPGKYISCM